MVKIDLCEERLAFSAMPFADVLSQFFGSNSLPHLDDVHDAHVADPHALTTSDLPYSAAVSSSQYDQSIDVFAQQSSAHSLTGLTAAQAKYGIYGQGQTVAVIDTGIAYDHVDLGAGYGSGHKVVGGYDFAENDAVPYDDAPAGYHGTAVAGVIASDATGVAPGVDLVALRVFDDYRRGNLTYVESALRWVHDNRNSFENPITIVNLSLGVDFNTNTPLDAVAILEDELQQLKNDGIIVIASAGNAFAKYQSQGLAYPASSSLVLPVSSVDDNGLLSDFSQRSQNSIAAPGRNISSTVPDYMLGADGNPNDYTTVSGTSFSSPYVAGATALIREAYHIIGIDNVTVDTIKQTLFSTADRIFDSITNAYYSRLNIQNALDYILPDDTVGDTLASAFNINHNSLTSGNFNGFIDHLGDKDVYQWTATTSGTLEVHFGSSQLDDAKWLQWNGGQESQISADGTVRISVQAGQSYNFGVTDANQIGAFTLNWDFVADTTQSMPTNVTPVDLGVADLDSVSVNSNGLYTLETSNNGYLTLQVSGVGSQGSLRLYNAAGEMLLSDTTVENGVLRLDYDAQDSTRYYVQVQGAASNAKLDIANLVDLNGRNLTVNGTNGSDTLAVSFANGIDLQLGAINYHFATNQIDSLAVDQSGGADNLIITGNALNQTVEMYSNHGSLTMTNFTMQWTGSERVQFDGVSGPDRVYAYDTDGNDQLTIYPNRCQLDGAGYQFIVNNVERLYIDASSGGNDQAYMFDSAGDDYLSIRPQYSSMRGNGFFNYVTGFERVYAYATNGGNDTAVLYDSSGDDRYATSGDNASIVGYNYYAYTKYFENVESIANSGGNDVASIYSPNNAVNYVGSDFVSVQYSQLMRTARGFATVQSLQLQSQVPTSTNAFSIEASDVQESPSVASEADDVSPIGGVIDAAATQTLAFYSNVDSSIESGIGDSSIDESMPDYSSSIDGKAAMIGWMSEDASELYLQSKVDPMTAEMMNIAAEISSLEKFFQELAEGPASQLTS